MLDELKLRENICEVMKIAHERGLVNVLGGNASIRYGDGFIITPSQVPKHLLKPSDIIYMKLNGTWYGKLTPSMEWKMHAEIYRKHSWVNAILHTHNPYTLAIYLSGLSLKPSEYVEAYSIGECISVVNFHTPGSQDLAKAVADAVSKCRSVVLLGHGVVSVSDNIFKALDAVEAMEDLSRIEFIKFLLNKAHKS
jgi:L-fuculose-phosphate aldolase